MPHCARIQLERWRYPRCHRRCQGCSAGKARSAGANAALRDQRLHYRGRLL